METFVGVLAIGNEVVEGQITNRNAAWLSQELSLIGAQSLFHLSCRDNDTEIQQCLEFLGSRCHLVIVTGGLGPTKDDFTRQSLSRWLAKPLVFNDEYWEVIRKKLEDRKLTLRDGHKNQALIPQDATLLPNSKGVAPGFFTKTSSCFLASLPGPPNELQAMFKESLKELIQKKLSPKSEFELKTWICLGAPESDIAHIVESFIGESLEIGYRLHRPYVEVKIWLPTQISKDQQKRLELMEEKLEPWLVGSSIKNIRKNFHDKLEKFDHVFVIDHLTSGLMLEKLKEEFHSDHLRYQCFEHRAFRYFSKSEIEQILQHMGIEQNSKNLFISLFPESEHSAHLAFNGEIKSLKLPRNISIQSKLGQLYIIENCFLESFNG